MTTLYKPSKPVIQTQQYSRSVPYKRESLSLKPSLYLTPKESLPGQHNQKIYEEIEKRYQL